MFLIPQRLSNFSLPVAQHIPGLSKKTRFTSVGQTVIERYRLAKLPTDCTSVPRISPRDISPSTVKSSCFRCMFLITNALPYVRGLRAKRYSTCFPRRRANYRSNLESLATRPGIPRTRSMREETSTAVGYNPILKREVVVHLTYSVGEGPRPDIIRWFLVRKEMQGLPDSQSSTARPLGTPPSG